MSTERTQVAASGAPLRAVPTLAFEVTQTIGTVTTAGMGPGYPDQNLTLLGRDAALSLQRALGVDAFATLEILLLTAKPVQGGLCVEGATEVVRSQTGWGRPKVTKIIAQLEAGGFVRRTQDRTGRGFSTSRCWVTPDLYTAVERHLTVTQTEVRRGDTSRGVTESNSTPPDPGVTERDTTGRGSTNPNTAGDGAGQPGDRFRDTTRSEHHHDDEHEDENHGAALHDHDRTPHLGLVKGGQERVNPAGQNAELQAVITTLGRTTAMDSVAEDVVTMTVEEVRSLRLPQVLALLESWRVYGAAQIVKETPSHKLLPVVEAVVSRLDSITNPGAYFRELLRDSARGQVPTPRRPGLTPRPEPTQPPRTHRQEQSSRAPGAQADDDPSQELSASQRELDIALDAIHPDTADQIRQMAEEHVQRTGWARGALGDALRRQVLTEELVRLGALRVAG